MNELKLIPKPKTRQDFIDNIEYYDNLLLSEDNKRIHFLKEKKNMEYKIEQGEEIDINDFRNILKNITTIKSTIDKLIQKRIKVKKQLNKKCPCNNYYSNEQLYEHNWTSHIMNDKTKDFACEEGFVNVCSYCDSIANYDGYFYDYVTIVGPYS